MAEHAYSVLCEKLLRDENSSVASFIAILEKIKIPGSLEDLESVLEGAAGIRFPMRLVTWLVRSDYSSPEIVDLRVGWLCPDGEYVNMAENPISLENNTSLRVQAILPGVPWHGWGLYWLLVEKRDAGGEWSTGTRLPLELVREEPDESDSQG